MGQVALLMGVLAICAGVALYMIYHMQNSLARVEGYSFAEQSIEFDNPAVLIRYAGLAAGMLWGTMCSHIPSPNALVQIAHYGEGFILSAFALTVNYFIADYLILPGVKNTEAVVKNRNVAVAAVEGATFVATALIFSGSMKADGSFWNVAAWFVIGQALFIGLAQIYNRLMGGAFKAIEDGEGNAACGVALAGFLLSAGYVIGSVVGGEHTFVENLKLTGLSVLLWLVAMALFHTGINYLAIAGSRTKKEIMFDKNWGVAIVDATLAITFSVIIVQHFAGN